MPPFNVLEDYVVRIVMSSPEGHSGEIWHVFPTKDETGVRTRVGFFMAFIAEPSEIRPTHWEVQLFLRSDVRYDPSRKISEAGAVRHLNTKVHYHSELPAKLGEALIEHNFCDEPIALSVSLYQNTDFIEFGKTWLDDDE